MSNEARRHRLRNLLLLVTVSLLLVSACYLANILTDSYRTWIIINQELKRSQMNWLTANPPAIEIYYLDHTPYILFLESPFADERSGTVVQKCIFATVFYITPSDTIEYKFVILHDEQFNKTRLLLSERSTYSNPLPRTRCVYPAVTE